MYIISQVATAARKKNRAGQPSWSQQGWRKGFFLVGGQALFVLKSFKQRPEGNKSHVPILSLPAPKKWKIEKPVQVEFLKKKC